MTDNSQAASPPPAFRDELAQLWARLPYKALAGTALVLWLGLFHFLGNSTLGYVKTTSLFGWIVYAYEQNADDQIGYLMPFAVLGLMWWKRRDLMAAPKRIWWPALALVVAGLLVHFVGFVVQQARVSIIGFFIGMYGLTGLVWGPQWLRATFFPYFLFAFCVPLGNTAERITFPLRLLATKISVAVCHWALWIDVIREGTRIWNRAHTFEYEIAAACGGIRSLTAFLAFTLIFSFVFLNQTWRRLALIGSAIPLAVLANVTRLLMIIIAAEAFGQQAGNWVHENFLLSLLPYVPAMAGVLLLGRWLQEKTPPERASDAPAAARAPTGPQEAGAAVIGGRTSRQVWVAGVVLLALLGGSGVILAQHRAHQRLGRPGVKVGPAPMYGQENNASGTNGLFLVSSNSVLLPERVLDYESHTFPVPRVVYEWLPKDTVYGQRFYKATNGFAVANTVVLMGGDRTSIHQPQYCLTGQGFQILKTEKDTLRIARPHPYDLQIVKLTATRESRDRQGRAVTVQAVYVYWFVADGQLSTDHAERMWWMARDLLRSGVLQRWAYVTYMAYCLPGQEQATYEHMKQMIVASVPKFQLTAGPPVTNTAGP